MKLTHLFEQDNQAHIKEYILLNTLFGTFGMADREAFLKFYHSSKDEFKATAYINKMPVGWQKNFWDENESDLKFYKISGNEVEFEMSFVLYIYDFAGAPPFKFKKNFEVYSFGMFEQCKTLTELPAWFPNRVNKYQQVGTSIKSLKNIHKVIESAGDLYFGKDETISKASYIAGIKNLDYVEFSGIPNLTKSVNNYLKSAPKNDRDIFDLQEHLIGDNLEAYA